MRVTKAQYATLQAQLGGDNGAAHNDRKRRAEGDGRQGRDKLFDAACAAHGLPLPVHEFLFAAEIGRKWRFDYLWDGWLALEVQGGIFTAGRHVQGAALLAEHEKLNAAVVLGYSVLFCTPRQVHTGEIFATVKAALEAGQ